MLLSLDLATRTGYALGGPDDGAPRKFGTWKLPGLDDLKLDESLRTLHDTVLAFCQGYGVKVVAIEAPLMMTDRSSHTALGLISLAAVARCAAQEHGARIIMAHVQSVRKHFVGTGRPNDPKRAVIARCQLLGWYPEDDNQADAMALWCFAMSASYRHWSPNGTPLFAQRGAA